MARVVNKETLVILCFLLLCLFQSFAFFQPDSTLNPISFKGTYLALSFAIIGYLFLVYNRNLCYNTVGLLFVFSVCAYWMLEYTHSFGKLTFPSSTVYLVIIPYFFLNHSLQEKIYRAFVKVVFWMSLIGILIFIVYIFNLLPPLSVVDYYEEDMVTSSYANYLFGYLFITDYGLTRFCGLFNEPGFFGTIAILTLISRKFKMDSVNIVILIASLFTFSLAFFALLLIYFALKAIAYKKVKFLFLIAILLTSVFYLSTKELNDSNLLFFLQRVIPEDGGLISNNRTSYDLEQAWSIFINDSEKLFFGYGPFLSVKGSSYKIMIMKHGIIGMVLIFVPFILACFKLARRNKDSVLLIIIFIISIYQRPQIFNLAYFVVLIGGILHLRSSEVSNSGNHPVVCH